MGRVSILTGRSGSGKSRYLRRMVAELIKKGERVLYIVPEQFTFETERALAEAMGCGLWDADVFSFTSLARRVLNEFGERRTLMSEQGRLMVIRKCADELAPKLISFGRVYHRGGFTGECARFFIEAKRAGIEADALMDAANEIRRLAQSCTIWRCFTAQAKHIWRARRWMRRNRCGCSRSFCPKASLARATL